MKSKSSTIYTCEKPEVLNKKLSSKTYIESKIVFKKKSCNLLDIAKFTKKTINENFFAYGDFSLADDPSLEFYGVVHCFRVKNELIHLYVAINWNQTSSWGTKAFNQTFDIFSPGSMKINHKNCFITSLNSETKVFTIYYNDSVFMPEIPFVSFKDNKRIILEDHRYCVSSRKLNVSETGMETVIRKTRFITTATKKYFNEVLLSYLKDFSKIFKMA